MRRLVPFIAFITLMLIICLTLASSASSEVITAADNHISVWKVTNPNDTSEKNIIYLLGSLSITDKSIFPLNEQIEKIYNESSKIIVETDSTKTTQDQTVTALLKYGLLSKTTIDKVLTKEQYNKADALIKKYTQNKKSLSTYKSFMPWVIESLVSNLVISSSQNFLQNPIPSYFIGKAKKDGKSIVEIESPDSQLSRLSSMSYSLQSSLLENTIKAIENDSETVKKATVLWKDGDIEGLINLYSFINATQSTVIQKTFDCVTKSLKSGGKYFAIADISRLTGENGIINMLKKNGYKVEQL